MLRAWGMRPVRLLAAVLLVTSLAVGPVAAQQSDALVPQSLWGVKSDVGLGLVGEYVTNHGDRSFWEARPSGEDVRVAVVDTGVDLSHPDLQGSLACEHCWRDLVHERPDPYDDHGHGTHVSGIIAADGHLQWNPLQGYFPTGAQGVASDAELIVAKAMNESGQSSDQRVAEAVEWAVDPDGTPGTGDEPHVLHLSIAVDAPADGQGNVDAGSRTEQAVQGAIEQGVHVVLSAGNQGLEGPANPGHVDGVLAVGALTSQGDVYEQSNRGEGVGVFAPGVVLSTWPRALDEDGIGDGYTGLAGTSQAAPVVTGALALTLGASPELRDASSATTVKHLASMVVETSRSVETEAGTVNVLDAGALLASQDEGTSEVALGVVAGFAFFTLAVVLLAVRAGWRALGSFVEENDSSALEPDRGVPEELEDAGSVQPGADSGPGELEGGSGERTLFEPSDE